MPKVDVGLRVDRALAIVGDVEAVAVTVLDRRRQTQRSMHVDTTGNRNLGDRPNHASPCLDSCQPLASLPSCSSQPIAATGRKLTLPGLED